MRYLRERASEVALEEFSDAKHRNETGRPL